MLLNPKIKITIADNGKSFIFLDETPTDNQTNSVNYWNGVTTRNNLNVSINTANAILPDQINHVDLLITKPDATEFAFADFDVPKVSTQYTILNTDIDETGVIPDGIYKFDYKLFVEIDLNDYTLFEGEEGDDFITFGGAYPEILEEGMIVKLGTSSTLYTIRELDPVDNIIYFEEILDATYADEENMYAGYQYTLYEVFDYTIACCIDKGIASAATQGCCDECLSDALKGAATNYILLLGAKSQARNGLYAEAQTTIELITKLCNNENPDCGCN
jgi:hypothetical protein